MRFTLTRKLMDEIKKLCKETGTYEKYMYLALGIPSSTWYNWKQRAETLRDELETGVRKEKELIDPEIILLEFLETTDAAQARLVNDSLRDIHKAGSQDWRARAWYLEHVKPDDFAKKDKTEHSGKIEGGGVFNIEFPAALASDPDAEADPGVGATEQP